MSIHRSSKEEVKPWASSGILHDKTWNHKASAKAPHTTCIKQHARPRCFRWISLPIPMRAWNHHTPNLSSAPARDLHPQSAKRPEWWTAAVWSRPLDSYGGWTSCEEVTWQGGQGGFPQLVGTHPVQWYPILGPKSSHKDNSAVLSPSSHVPFRLATSTSIYAMFTEIY